MSSQVATSIESLRLRFSRIARLDHASTYLGWDRQVVMPPGGAEARGAALAEIATLRHEMLTSPEVGDWLDEAGAEPLDRVLEASLLEMRRSYLESTALPASLVRAQVIATSRCEQAWGMQRAANDWAGFLVNFREVVTFAREEADARRAAAPGRFGSRYEALLDLYCAGEKPERIAEIFNVLRARLPPLLERVMQVQMSRPAPVLPVGHPIAAQEALGRRLAERLGFDFARGRLDISLHPFSTGERGDLRITTRYTDAQPYDALQAIAHEIGHASYEGGLPEAFADEPVGQARSMSVHESQSLFFEKHLFLSSEFQTALATDSRRFLPALERVEADTIRRSQLGVRPSLIRVEADEVSYPLHVILRHEIESALIDGRLEPDDIPDAWDAGIGRYFGLDTRGNYRDGCLQDIHWSGGAFGYFPSYTLGAIGAAQLAAALDRESPDWRARVAAGDIDLVRDWMSSRIWERASLVDTGTLLRDATGSDADPEALLSHLERRYIDEA